MAQFALANKTVFTTRPAIRSARQMTSSLRLHGLVSRPVLARAGSATFVNAPAVAPVALPTVFESTETPASLARKLSGDANSNVAETVQLEVENELDMLLQPPLDHQMYHASRYLTCDKGHRRLSSIMSYGACEAVGANSALALPVSCAVEMFIAATQQLDDLECMDDHKIRYGKAPAYKVFGEGVTICSALHLITLGIDNAVTSLRPFVAAKDINTMTQELCRYMTNAAAGQSLELQSRFMGLPATLDVESYRFIRDNNSAAIAERSLTAAAAAGGATHEEIETLRKIGHAMGQAWWIIDDIRDCQDDAKADRVSYPGFVGLEAAQQEASQLLNEATAMLWGMANKAGRPASSISTLLSVIAKMRAHMSDFAAKAVSA
jgi:geranylgeranyl diphosphate synthase type II